MSTSLLYRPEALKALKKLPQKEQEKILHKIELLSDNPFAGKWLRGEFGNLRCLRVWPYRVLYTFAKGQMTIWTMGHRQSVYK